MNKLRTMVLALASMVSFCGCINDPLVQETPKDSTIKIHAYFAETKTNHTSLQSLGSRETISESAPTIR